jgi:penicillin-binding protein 1A
LVGGAWVGGEHRCIHFRTGKLGSGGKIALPIVGTFFKKVLTDAQYASYRGRFSDKPKQTIDRTYNCGSSYIAAPSQDSLSGDSLQEEFGEEIPSEVIEESMTKE